MEFPDNAIAANFQVTVGLPRPKEEDLDAVEPPRVNLFLYRVTENGALKNQEIPGQGHPGAYGYPPLSLDLHYLLTSYGSTKGTDEQFVLEILAHDLLGSAMRVFHEYPVVTEDLRDASGQPVLDPAIRGEFEQVKLYLDPISLEDLSKVWTALNLTYQLSTAYKVSVVQIESERPRTYPRLVGEPPRRPSEPPRGPKVFVPPFRNPQIRELRVRRADDPTLEKRFPYARIDDTLIILGHNFASEATRVLVDTVEGKITSLQDDRIEVEIPDKEALQPGAHPVKVVLDIGLPHSPQARPVFQSNLAGFMLVPRIKAIEPPEVTQPAGGGAPAIPTVLRVTGSRLFHADLECVALIGDRAVPSDDYFRVTSTRTEFADASGDTTASALLLSANTANSIATLSGTHAASPEIPSQTAVVEVTVDGITAPGTLTFPPGTFPAPVSLADVAPVLETAIQAAAPDNPIFNEAIVLVADDRLVVLPGGITPAQRITFADASEDETATALRLTRDATHSIATLSGTHAASPEIPSQTAVVEVTVDGITAPGTLTFPPGTFPAPVSLADVAPVLETAIQAAAPDNPIFNEAIVLVADDRLVVLPGGITTERQVTLVVPEGLGIGDHPVRVRVNGMESIDDKSLKIL